MRTCGTIGNACILGERITCSLDNTPIDTRHIRPDAGLLKATDTVYKGYNLFSYILFSIGHRPMKERVAKKEIVLYRSHDLRQLVT